MYKLSEGSLDKIINGNHQDIEQPVFQLLDYKKLRNDTSDQYKLVVSDGVKKYPHTMLSTGLNYLFENGTFTKYAVFKVLSYKVNSTDKERKVLTIIDGEVLFPAKEVQRMIGNPTENKVESASDKPRSSAVHHEVMEDTMQLPSTSKSTHHSSVRNYKIPNKRKSMEAEMINKSRKTDSDRKFEVVATINEITYSIFEKCPTEHCGKKLVGLSLNKFKCKKCDKEYTNFKYGLMLRMNILDSTNSDYDVIAFNDKTENLLDMSVQDLGKLNEVFEDASQKIIDKIISKKCRFLLRNETNIFQGKKRNRNICISITPIESDH